MSTPLFQYKSTNDSPSCSPTYNVLTSAFVYTKHIQQRDPLDQAYEIVFNTIIAQSSKEKIEEYKTLLKMSNNDYRSTVLAIETK